MDVPIELCVSAKVYKASTFRRGLITAFFIILYSIAIPYCYYTSGSPRKAAMINAQKIADERWASLGNSTGNANDTLLVGAYDSKTLEELEVLPDSSLSRLISSNDNAAFRSGDAANTDNDFNSNEGNDGEGDSSTHATGSGFVADYSQTGQQSSSSGWFGNLFGPSKVPQPSPTVYVYPVFFI